MGTEITESAFDSAAVSSLGLSAVEPGFACIRVAPKRSGTTMSGTLTIPGGLVYVDLVELPDKYRLEVSVPVGIHLQVRLPAGLNDQLFIDGEPIAEDTQTTRDAHYVELAVLPGSKYVFEVYCRQP